MNDFHYLPNCLIISCNPHFGKLNLKEHFRLKVRTRICCRIIAHYKWQSSDFDYRRNKDYIILSVSLKHCSIGDIYDLSICGDEKVLPIVNNGGSVWESDPFQNPIVAKAYRVDMTSFLRRGMVRVRD